MAILGNGRGSRDEAGSAMKPSSARRSMKRSGGIVRSVARTVLLLLGVGGLAFLSGAAAQTCATGSSAVAVVSGSSNDHVCAVLVSKRLACHAA